MSPGHLRRCALRNLFSAMSASVSRHFDSFWSVDWITDWNPCGLRAKVSSLRFDSRIWHTVSCCVRDLAPVLRNTWISFLQIDLSWVFVFRNQWCDFVRLAETRLFAVTLFQDCFRVWNPWWLHVRYQIFCSQVLEAAFIARLWTYRVSWSTADCSSNTPSVLHEELPWPVSVPFLF